MRRWMKISLVFLLIVLGVNFLTRQKVLAEKLEDATHWVAGTIIDKQQSPVEHAELSLIGENEEIIATAISQPDGRFTLIVPGELPDIVTIHIERPHFASTIIELPEDAAEELKANGSLILPTITLEREIRAAFWVATLIFIVVLVFIATGVLHNTLSALVGASALFLFSYMGHAINEGLFIFDFSRSLGYIDWNVIFLIMGMMIVIAVIEETGVFQWLAYFAYKMSGGRLWLLLPILMLITGVTSAFLDNVTTMLLMAPISIQISIALGVNPFALIIPEVMASNVIGVSTLVGTPTNILIGSYGKISFNDFLTNLTPGVLLAFLGLVGYSLFIYRKDLAKAREGSDLLEKKLAEAGKITRPIHLKKAGVVGGVMLVMFIFGEQIHLLPAVTALIGATALMVWIRPDIEEMIEAVDWTTLVFFMSLFIVVGAIQEVGLISFIASWIAKSVGTNLLMTMLTVIWLSAILSTIVANIPFTAAMLPVIGYLTATVPGADTKVLFYCLSVGAAMGGNGSLIGASANMVTAGISSGAGYVITYAEFFKKGMPALLITVSLATVWLLIHF